VLLFARAPRFTTLRVILRDDGGAGARLLHLRPVFERQGRGNAAGVMLGPHPIGAVHRSRCGSPWSASPVCLSRQHPLGAVFQRRCGSSIRPSTRHPVARHRRGGGHHLASTVRISRGCSRGRRIVLGAVARGGHPVSVIAVLGRRQLGHDARQSACVQGESVRIWATSPSGAAINRDRNPMSFAGVPLAASLRAEGIRGWR